MYFVNNYQGCQVFRDLQFLPSNQAGQVVQDVLDHLSHLGNLEGLVPHGHLDHLCLLAIQVYHRAHQHLYEHSDNYN